MKKIIFILFFAFTAISSYSQQLGTFMGIKLGINIDSFTKLISSKGFEYNKQDDRHPELYYYNGAYLGQYVELLVLTTPQTHKVRVVSVLFNSYKIGEAYEADIKGYYKELKNKIKTKYGKPTNNDYTIDKIGGCYTSWSNSIGRILLGYSEIKGDHLSVSFEDFKTSEIAKKEEDSYL